MVGDQAIRRVNVRDEIERHEKRKEGGIWSERWGEERGQVKDKKMCAL
ncbi:uncharacterized protein G2W53_044266 [Senna tora]|uniref:Uncharacterized protein n=1 Tax=Senna tora TaxID=362788 RepID=A0A834SML3_9FABA|nr:uncharacterized protein G2W53_044266 [Senna tora]